MFDSVEHASRYAHNSTHDVFKAFSRALDSSVLPDIRSLAQNVLELRNLQGTIAEVQERRMDVVEGGLSEWMSRESSIASLDFKLNQDRLELQEIEFQMRGAALDTLYLALAALRHGKGLDSTRQTVWSLTGSPKGRTSPRVTYEVDFDRHTKDGGNERRPVVSFQPRGEKAALVITPEAFFDLDSNPELVLIDTYIACCEARQYLAYGAVEREYLKYAPEILLGVKDILKKAWQAGSVFGWEHGSYLDIAWNYVPAGANSQAEV